jgi:hypothetical protein
MSKRLVSFVLVAAMALSSRAADPIPSEPTSLADLSLEVEALLALHQFGFSPAQRETLRKLAPETAQKSGKRREITNDPLRQALLALRAELLKDVPDDDRIGELEEKVDELKAAEADLDADIDITDAARRHAPELLRQLTPRQLVAYLNEHAEDIPDPLERLLEAIDKAPSLNNRDWQELCEEIVDELSRVMGGVDKKRARAVGSAVEQWLTQVRLATKGKSFERLRVGFERNARQFAAQVSPTTVLHNFTEHALAELFANPRLGAALEARPGHAR